jgi:hypothetical protein
MYNSFLAWIGPLGVGRAAVFVDGWLGSRWMASRLKGMRRRLTRRRQDRSAKSHTRDLLLADPPAAVLAGLLEGAAHRALRAQPPPGRPSVSADAGTSQRPRAAASASSGSG